MVSSFLRSQDYLKSVVPSQLIAERGSNLVVINPGSANIRIGLASQDAPFNVPHCIARYTNQVPKRNVQDQMLNSQVTTAQHMERERAYDVIASLLKIPFLDEEVANSSFPRKMGRVDGHGMHNGKKDTVFSWTDVHERDPTSPVAVESSSSKDVNHEPLDQRVDTDSKELTSSIIKYRQFICGEDALKISPSEPYCLHRPIRRGHLNISQHYPTQQEGLAAVFGNGLSSACVVNVGSQVTTVICIEDGVALPATAKTLPFGGEDLSRCLLWTQRHHQTWPPICTDILSKPVDLLMLNRLKESYCEIREGEVDAVAVVHSYEEGTPPSSHKTRLTALNVPPMGLFFPMLLVPDVYPPPPRAWFHDYEDMLEETWQTEYSKRPDVPDNVYPGVNVNYPMWDSYPVYATKPKKEEKVGLAEAITSSILLTGRIDLQRKLFLSIQLVGGVALTRGLIPAMEERVLHAIPSNEAIDTVEVLQSRINPSFVSWKGGAIIGVLDFGRDAWIHREDWINSGIFTGSGRKYKDSYYLQAQAMCYMNS